MQAVLRDHELNIAVYVCVPFCVASKRHKKSGSCTNSDLLKKSIQITHGTLSVIICSPLSCFSLVLKRLSLVPTADVVSGNERFK